MNKNPQGSWKPGQSGNPNGRPKKERVFTEILKRAGSQTIEVDGKRVTRKRELSRMIWEVTNTGKLTFSQPDGSVRTMAIKDFTEWQRIVTWIYSQVDGPPPGDLNLNHSGGIELVWDLPTDGDNESESAS